ncbi:DEAD/DEAH box helicase [Gemella cuniculi]|uniref:DEAD/DEAH box helicase n=1 Tax=Gemella cuniculi TaxID=150240 RepID=UPI001FDF2E73|nr:DEAD/DEAH box helicase [Gemella cuniculi]
MITYCTRCIEFGRSDNRLPRFHINFPITSAKKPQRPAVNLSPIQKEASDKVFKNFLMHSNSLVWAVCGAGKTEIVYNLIYNSIILNKKICLAIPRKDVVKELFLRFSRDFGDFPINILHGDEKTLVDSPFYIMTTHQLIKYYNYFDLIIIDEVDAFPYYGDELLEEGTLTSLTRKGSLVFLSATPSKKIKNFVNEIIKIPIRYHRYLLPIPKIKIEKDEIFTFEKNSKYIEKFVLTALINKRRVLIFVPAITMCEKAKYYLEKILNNKDIVIDFVYSEDKKRAEKIEKFYNKKINILVTTTILERGVTFDFLDILVFDASHSHFTKEALIQIAGRVGRKDYDYSGEIIFLANKINKNMKAAIKEIRYMNNLAKYRKLNRE